MSFHPTVEYILISATISLSRKLRLPYCLFGIMKSAQSFNFEVLGSILACMQCLYLSSFGGLIASGG